MGTATLCGTQNVDAVNITGGNLAGVTISAAVILASSITQASGRAGTFTLNGTTPVTISSSSLAITDAIVISLNTVGGTVGVQPHVATVTAGQATVIGTASDSSIYNWALIKTA